MTFNYIQLCRGVAAALVALFHLSGAVSAEKYFNEPVFSWLFRFGSAGVEFFFVLSGFIITHAHLKDIGKPTALPKYLTRRAIRMYPSYWIVFIGVALIAVAVPAFREVVPADAVVLVKSLLLVPQDQKIVGGTGAPVIIVAWSMQYELVFYALFGLFIISPVVGAGALGLLCVWWLAAAFVGFLPRFPLDFMKPHYFAIFVVGVLAAFATRQGRVRSPVRWLVAGLCGCTALASFESAEMIIGRLTRIPDRLDSVSFGYGLFSGLIVCGLVALEQQRPADVPRPFILLGDASYVLYLVHFPIISACCKVLSIVGKGFLWTSFSFLLIFAICCVVSIAFYLLIERPILNWLRARTSRARDTGTVAAPSAPGRT